MDLYELLGVRRGASVAEIRRAYQKQARLLHPDLNPGDPRGTERFRAVSRAFEVLSDPQRRADYDRGHELAQPVPAAAQVGFEGFDFSAEVRVGAVVGFREIFDGVLRGAQAAVAPVKGEDLEQSARVSFAEALAGARRRIHLVRQDQCPVCQGAGLVAMGPIPCPRCLGAGQVRATRGHMIFSRGCPDCGASGRLGRRPCGRCHGEGRVMQSEWIEVEIPAGVAQGSRLRVPGAGNAGRNGGEPGDFVLVVEVEPHPFYRREGDGLHCLIPLSVPEAALGAHVQVPTPEGPVTIEIPAGTQTGQRFRLRKRGMPKVGEKGRGDLYAEAQVVVPRVSDERSRELLREFARLNPDDPRKDLAAAAAARKKE